MEPKSKYNGHICRVELEILNSHPEANNQQRNIAVSVNLKL